jgi:hypothetical protein
MRDIIKCWGSKQDAERVAARLKGRTIEILYHVGFMGCPNWIIRYNGRFLTTTDNVVLRDNIDEIRKGHLL